MYNLPNYATAILPTPTGDPIMLACDDLDGLCPHTCQCEYYGNGACFCPVDAGAHLVYGYCVKHADSRCTMCQPLGFRRDMSRNVDASSKAADVYANRPKHRSGLTFDVSRDFLLSLMGQ